MSKIVETSLGTFRKVAGPETPFLDRWTFACPGCGKEAYLDDDQWHGRVSVDHASMGCPGGYHETHDYFATLEATLNGAFLSDEQVAELNRGFAASPDAGTEDTRDSQ